jgi:hypothetical protein
VLQRIDPHERPTGGEHYRPERNGVGRNGRFAGGPNGLDGLDRGCDASAGRLGDVRT